MREQTRTAKLLNKLPIITQEGGKVFGKFASKILQASGENAFVEAFLGSSAIGKILGYTAKYIVEIDSCERAFHHALALTYSITFQEAIAERGLEHKVKNTDSEDYKIHLLNQTNLHEDYPFDEFDVNDFFSNKIIKLYSNIFINILKDCAASDEDCNMLERDFNLYLEEDFHTITQHYKVVYQQLIDAISNKKAIMAQGKRIQRNRYYDQLKTMFDDVVLNDEKGMRLSDIYIRPRFKAFQSCFKYIPRCDNKFAVLDDENRDLHTFINDFLKSKIHKKLECQKTHIAFLFGNPGQGKTSFCKKLLHDAISKYKTSEKNIYFLRLKKIEDIPLLFTKPLHAIVECLKDTPNIPDDISVKQLRKGSLLILDGLDELSMNAQVNHQKIEEICTKLIKQTEDYEGLKIVLTSRYYVDMQKITDENALILQIDELTETQQFEWLKKYRHYHPESHLTAEQLKLYNEKKHLRELLTQAILLHLVAELSESIDVTKNKAGIYDKLFTDLIKRKWDKKQIAVLKDIKPALLRSLIQEMALDIFQSEHDYLHKTEILELKTVKRFGRKLGDNHLNDVLKGIMIAFYFQETKKTANDRSKVVTERNENYAIEFMHKSLQEYMTAEAIWQKLRKSFLNKGEDEEYILEEGDTKDAYKICAELFGPKVLSVEIMGYIKEMISAEKMEKREELAERLASFLDELIDIQFFDADSHKDIMRLTSKKHIDISMNIFYAFWHILLELKEGVNYLNETKFVSQDI